MAVLPGTQIISIIGQQGSGKTEVATYLAVTLGVQHIEASSVVRELHGDLARVDMPRTNERTAEDPGWLGRAIAERITGLRVVLSGVREEEVHQYFLDGGAELAVIPVWAPEQERFARLLSNGKCNDFIEFKTHGQNEMEIGLDKLLAKYSEVVPTTPYPVDITVSHICRLLGEEDES